MEKDVYINIGDAALYVFKSRGLLVSKQSSEKINRDIAVVLADCSKNNS